MIASALIKNFTLPVTDLANVVLLVSGFPANIICSFEIYCSALNFLSLLLSKVACLKILLILSFNCFIYDQEKAF